MKYAEPVKGLKMALWKLGDVTQWFAENPELYQKHSNGEILSHNGIDIVRPYGEHLFAVDDGYIRSIKDDPTGYGRNIRLLTKKTNSIHYDWVYAHLSHIAVQKGDRVRKGQFIGCMGNSGFVVSNQTANGYWDANPYRGTHLHLGVREVKHYFDKDKREWLNYNNGHKGRYDPVPLFRDPELLSSKIINLASVLQNKKVFQIGQVFRAIGK